MADLGLEDARRLAGWQPELGVISIYLHFDPGDRGERWRSELNNGLDRIVGAQAGAEHGRRMALRSTAKRLHERFNNGAVRPPPRGEAGFVEVSESPGQERWWAIGSGGGLPAVTLAAQPLLAPLVGLLPDSRDVGVVLLSAERVRLLHFAVGCLEEVDGWELSITSGDWRERKSQGPRDPAGGQGGSSSGHDQYRERLEHNRRRFLGECGRLAGARRRRDGASELIAFGPRPDFEAFAGHSAVDGVRHVGEDDLISVPTGRLVERVAAVVDELAVEAERELVERTLAEARGGSRGAAGLQETQQALSEGRVEHLVFDPAIGERAEALIRGAFSGHAEVTIVRDGAAELLAPAEGIAAILRY